MAAGWKPKVAASNLQSGRRRDRPRLRLRPVRLEPVGRRRRHRGGQEDREDRRQAHVHLAEQRHHDQPAARREPDERRGDPGPVAGAVRAGRRSPRSGSRACDWVTYPILRFKDTPKVTLVNVHPGKHTIVVAGRRVDIDVSAGNTAAFNAGWNLSGSGEPPQTAVGCGGRQRVLRRHGCAHPHRADEPGERPGSAQGGRQVAEPSRTVRGARRRAPRTSTARAAPRARGCSGRAASSCPGVCPRAARSALGRRGRPPRAQRRGRQLRRGRAGTRRCVRRRSRSRAPAAAHPRAFAASRTGSRASQRSHTSGTSWPVSMRKGRSTEPSSRGE